jgi:hypothetical protein
VMDIDRLAARVVSASVTTVVLAAAAGGLVLMRPASATEDLPIAKRAEVRTESLPAAVGAPTVEAQLGAAALAIEEAVSPGGEGYTFEIVQRNTIYARPGGPQIEVPDPVDRYKSLGFTDEYYLNGLIERGAVSADGFWMEMRAGPATADAPPDFEKSDYLFGAIAKDGEVWRTEGVGWYETDSPPGIGLDPTTAQLLPRLLRNAASLEDAGLETIAGELLVRFSGRGEPVDFPGVIAADGESLTAPSMKVDFWLDAQGRLVRLLALARNTRMEDFDLISETLITFRYEPAGAIPDPRPSLAPDPPPPSEADGQP